jgi:hypothetical protein
MAKQRKSSVRVPSGADIHGHGSITKGPVTEDMVENRARELAFIDGRNPNRVTASDRIQAKKELLGDASGDDAVDDTGIAPSGMGSPPVSKGRKIEPQLPTDDETEAQTVQEGLDEAEHDEMLQAAKTRPKNEG